MKTTAFIPGGAPLLRSNANGIQVSFMRCKPMMTVKPSKGSARLAALPAAAMAAVTSTAPVLASEGTGESLGVDSPILLVPFVLIPAVLLFLYLQFDGSQDKSDFFGAYDERRK